MAELFKNTNDVARKNIIALRQSPDKSPVDSGKVFSL